MSDALPAPQQDGRRARYGTAGAAHGTPIGYANQEDLFPEATIGINAAVEYANAELGGIGGAARS